MFDASNFAQLGSLSTWSIFAVLVIWLIRTWPHWKSRINEARKIELDHDGELRGDLMRRIRELEEAQSADRRSFNDQLSAERHRCDQELDEIRRRLTASEDENRGLLAMIRQNSSSTAQMIGRPDAAATSAVNRGKRER